MSEVCMDFGSSMWRDQMFSEPPARKIKSRTRWTHRHACWVEFFSRLAYVESRNELIGLLALEYLHRLKQIDRFKEQAFTTAPDTFGDEYTPDFSAEHQSKMLYAIEVKTARFINRQQAKEFESYRERFAEHGIDFLVWTDADPLVKPLRHNLLRLRRASSLYIEHEEVARLVHQLSNGPMPLWALYNLDLDLDLVCYAAWQGKVFLPLLEDIHQQTPVSNQPTEDLAARLLGTTPDMHAWWNSLEAAA